MTAALPGAFASSTPSILTVTDLDRLTHVGELLLAFVLSSVVGLERQLRGKSAGLRTQAIVGTASALFMLVSKYGFNDLVGVAGISIDPSRVAAQVVSGIGFLGAGIIITRRGAIRGLTTAASVWETAAIGMAAGAGLPVLALTVTGLHFVVVLGYTPLGRLISDRAHAERDVTVTYEDGRGILRDLLAACTARGWVIRSMAVLRGHEAAGGEAAAPSPGLDLVAVSLTLAGRGVESAVTTLGDVDGVVRVDRGEREDDEG
ncbi:MAG: MgtC/SapB family protein [Actinomycetes bacterium]